MNSLIRILHLEDNPRDAAMIRDRLEADGLACEIVLVDDKESFEAALAGAAFDLVLCDYNLPDYDGISAMKLAQEKQPDAPVVIISGSLSPEDAVACLKQGTTDYLLKQRLERLTPALKRALDEAEEHREHQRAEELLRQAEVKYRSIVDHAVEGIFQTSPDGRYLMVNAAMARILGFASPAELMEKYTDIAHQSYVHPEQREEFERRLATDGSLSGFECEYYRKDGSRVWTCESARAVRDEAGRLVCYEGVMEDITARKEAEQALRHSQQRLRALIENSEEGVSLFDAGGRILFFASPAVTRILGYSDVELVGQSFFDLIHPEDLPRAIEVFRQIVSSPGQLLGGQFRVRHQNGAWRWIESVGRNLLEEPSVQAIVVNFRDITERRRAAERDAKHRRKLHQLSELSLKLSGDPGTVFEEVVCMIAKLFDVPVVCLSEIAGQQLLFRAVFANGQLFRDAGGCPLNITPCATVELTKDLRIYDRIQEHFPQASFLRDHNATTYCGFPSLDGQGRVVAVTCLLDAKPHEFTEEDQEILRVIGQRVALEMERGQNLAERKNLERLALRTQRLESIGTLAGGVAHDLNNALAPILMSTQLLRMQYPHETQMIDTIETSARHGADMVHQLLTFAKGVEGVRLVIQPQHLLKEMLRIIQGTFPKDIELRTSCPDKLQTIIGDSTQLHQVLLNLCVNARDAMPNGGTLTLAAENVEIGAAYASAVPEAKPGRYVVWRVTDTGTGIPPQIVDRIFEPFFTTKGLDKGTGLGLSTVVGIVKSHGGFVQVHSTPGQGSTFAVYLPAEGSNKGDTAFPTKPGVTFQGNGETILVVDDEAAVREVTRAVLTKLNFKVLTAGEGTEALMQVSEHRAELRVVITDLHMPHMDGLTFGRVLKHMLPEAGIIVASGRFEEGQESEFKALGVSALLDKPFTQETLVAAVKTALQKSERV